MENDFIVSIICIKKWNSRTGQDNTVSYADLPWYPVYACVILSLSWIHSTTMCPHLTSNIVPSLHFISLSLCLCMFRFHCRLFLQCSECQAYNILTIIRLTAAFMLISCQAVYLCPLLDSSTHSIPTLQCSVSYHKHFFNSTFNLPDLKSPQTTIWHQPQLLHCDGAEQCNVI